jgi:hypothetical protein
MYFSVFDKGRPEISPETGGVSGAHGGNSSASSLSLFIPQASLFEDDLTDVTVILQPLKHIPTMRLSGLQRGVLALYRKCLRESRKKPAVSRFPST